MIETADFTVILERSLYDLPTFDRDGWVQDCADRWCADHNVAAIGLCSVHWDEHDPYIPDSQVSGFVSVPTGTSL